jgi:alpha-N-acetylglucosamine transferase
MKAGKSPIKGAITLTGLAGLVIVLILSMQYVLEEFRAREQGSRLLLAPITFKRFDTKNMRFAVAVLYTMEDAFGSLSQGACKIARQVRRMTNVDLVMLTLRYSKNMAKCGWKQIVVPVIESPEPIVNMYGQAKLYTKLHLWNLTQYERVLYLDLDTLPVAQFAQLFEQKLDPSCDAGAMVLDIIAVKMHDTQYFNAGVILVLPSKRLWHDLMGNVTLVSHDHSLAEQNYVNVYLKGRICPLPRKYNSMVFDRTQFEPKMVIIHYTGVKVYHRFRAWQVGLNDLVAAWDLA